MLVEVVEQHQELHDHWRRRFLLLQLMLRAEQRLTKGGATVSMQLVRHVVVVREGGVQTQRGIPTRSHRTQERVQQQHEPQEKLRDIPLSHQTQQGRVQQRLEEVVVE